MGADGKGTRARMGSMWSQGEGGLGWAWPGAYNMPYAGRPCSTPDTAFAIITAMIRP